MADAQSCSFASTTTPSLSAVRNLALHSYGPMAVMTSPSFDKTPLDLKPSTFAPADGMTETNGVHDVLFDEPNSNTDPTDALAQPKTSINGDHTAMDTSAPAPAVGPAIAPTTNVSSGIDGVAQFMSDSQQDNNSLFGDSEMGATSVGHAVEAPTSDVREEPATAEELSAANEAAAESTQEVPETQLAPKEEPSLDAMDTSPDALADSKSTDVVEDSKLVDTSAAPTKPMNDLTIQTSIDGNTSQPALTQSPSIVDREMEDAPSSGKVRPREDDEDDVPDAKRTKTEDESNGHADFKVPEVPTHPEPASANGVSPAPGSSSAQEPSGVHNAVDFEEWPTTAMTNAQNKFLLERIRNTKKIKVALAFKDPVDHVALNIPTYPDIVTKPMDLSTMENKLKENKYTYIKEFMEDLDQMVVNSELFNNKQHPVTQAGYNLRAYFLKGMGKMPRGSVEEPPKPVKAKKPTVNTAPKPRRESRVAAPTVKSPAAPTPTAASPAQPWPLQDGVPVIRRDSSSANDRPKREIHRPSKDLPYASAKPRKKKYQQELKFCESVMAELTKPKYSVVTYPFMSPVDPVALNIPSYLKIIKRPMDFGTIDKNLKNGVYQSAKDFYNDAQLVFANCYKFNPEGDAVNKMGHQMEDLFESLWKEKADWLAQHAPAPEQSPEVYSDENDEEEEEEDEEVDPAQAQFLAIQQQIAALNETAQALLQQQKGGKRASPKAASKKKKGSVAAPKQRKASVPLAVPPPVKPSRQKARTKAPAPLTFNQKQEISEGISTLGDADMRKAVQIIRNGCPHLANVHDDEMELDMDEINDDTLRELFKFIKSIRGPKGGVIADDDFEPPRQASKQTTSRPKKNKPMGKTEQEDNMRKIQEKLQSFQGGASGSSQSPPAHDASSDDDDESSGSESEEE
ncbi:Bromodomain-containing protein [Setomelanomma holmii]|uniref:Bromodomain-containing protein n=1 Tax=Setomelanomma holmii TaxID=210430 RepID=A0A9P4HJ99_9PLEO|nr:Bromodomain-containing protein [Setomelanomma holmii]